MTCASASELYNKAFNPVYGKIYAVCAMLGVSEPVGSIWSWVMIRPVEVIGGVVWVTN